MKVLITMALFLLQGTGDVQTAPRDDLLAIYPDDRVVLKTEHYELHCFDSPQKAEEYGDLLEAARTQYAQLLAGAPKKSRKPVRVKLYPSKLEWRKGLEREQVIPPPVADFYYYSPERETIFVYRYCDEYWTRKVMLQGLFLQFHFRRKPKNQDLDKSWYVTGLADSLSTHLWDGEELVLNATHYLAAHNRAVQGLNRGLRAKVEQCDLSPASLFDYDVRWALTSFLLRDESGKYSERFKKHILGSRGSMLLGRDAARALGGSEAVVADLDRWLRGEARVLTPYTGEWRQNSRHLSGREYGEDQPAIALSEDPVREFQVKMDAGSGVGGLVLDWCDWGEYLVATIDETDLVIARYSPVRIERKAELVVHWPKDGVFALQLERKRHQVFLTVNGESAGGFDVEGDLMGLYVEEGPVAFSELAWR